MSALYGGNNENIDKEVSNLLKSESKRARSTYAIVDDLKRKYNDDSKVVDEILKLYAEKRKRLHILADKIAQRFNTKYPNYSVDEYLEKLREYKEKYNFDDDELKVITDLIFRRGDNKYPAKTVEYSTMSRALGFVPTSHNFIGKLTVSPEEKEQVGLIRNLHRMTSDLHNQVTL